MKFSPGSDNAKLRILQEAINKKVYSFSLLSGHTCPFAKECKSEARIDDLGHRYIHDGPDCKFRCFSASQEAVYNGTYNQRAFNTECVRRLVRQGYGAVTSAILKAIPKNAEAIRVHVAGDFFHKNYFLGWCGAACQRRDIHFYCYTKALPFLQDYEGFIPSNFIITMSRGGTHDHLIDTLKPRFHEARVVFDTNTDLPIDHNDTHAYYGQEDFALLVHGTQPKGSKAAQALSAVLA